MSIIETHCHLDMLKDIDLDVLVADCHAQKIEKIVTIATSEKNYQEILNLTKKYPFVYGTCGTHPHEAKSFSKDATSLILENIKKEKIVAVGEIGLDYHYNFSPREKQIEVFEAQLEIASDNNLPIVIHTREADEDMLAILKNFSAKLKSKGVLHSYTSGKELAEYAISENFFLGFNGIITFKNANEVREIVDITPLENMVIETDSPFLAPIPNRGRQNTPLNLPHIVKKISEMKEISETELLKVFKENSFKLFPKLV